MYLFSFYDSLLYSFALPSPNIYMVSIFFSTPKRHNPSSNTLRFLRNRHGEGSGGLTAGSHTILLCVIAPGFNINSFNMMPHTSKVRQMKQRLHSSVG